jgi:hypothetical protein
MSTTTTLRTTDSFGPILVSEMPPLSVVGPARSGLVARVREDLALRRQARRFDRALGNAGHNEQNDLLALSRRG